MSGRQIVMSGQQVIVSGRLIIMPPLLFIMPPQLLIMPPQPQIMGALQTFSPHRLPIVSALSLKTPQKPLIIVLFNKKMSPVPKHPTPRWITLRYIFP
jgi:hypothetical protein